MFTKVTVVALLAINIFLAQALPVSNPNHDRVDQLLYQLNKGPITHPSFSQTTSSTSSQSVSSSHNVPSTTNTLNFKELLEDPTFVAQLYAFLLKYQGASSSSQTSQLLSSSQTTSSGQSVGSDQSKDFKGIFSNPSFLNFLMSFITQSHKEINQNLAPAPAVVATTNQGDSAQISHVSVSHSTSSTNSNQAVTNNESQISNSHASTQVNGHSRPPVVVDSIQNEAIAANNQATSVVTVNQVSNQNQVASNQNQVVSNQNQASENNQASSVVLVNNQNQVVGDQNQVNGNNQVSSVVSVSNQNQVVSNQNQANENNQASSAVLVSNQNQVVSDQNQVNGNNQVSSVVSVNNQNQISSQNQVSNQLQENADNQASFVVSVNNQNQASANEVIESQVSDTSNAADADAVVIPVVVPSFDDRFGASNENSQTENSATAQIVSTDNSQSSESSNVQGIVTSSSDQTSQVGNAQDTSSSNSGQSLVFNEDLLRQMEKWFRDKAQSSESSNIQRISSSSSDQTSQVSKLVFNEDLLRLMEQWFREFSSKPVSHESGDVSQTSHSGQLNQGTQIPVFQVPIVPSPIVPSTPQIVIGIDNVMGGHASNAQHVAQKQVYNEAEERKMAQNAKYEFANQVRDDIEGNFQERAEVRNGSKVIGKYGYDDGSAWRTVYYEADENGFRVTKTIVDKSRMNKNPEGDANVQTFSNGNTVNYHITKKDIHARSKKPLRYGGNAPYGVSA